MPSDVFPTTSKYSKQVSIQESLPVSVDGQAITLSSSAKITNTEEEQIYENIPTENITNNKFEKESQSSGEGLNSALSQFNASVNKEQNLNFSSNIVFPTIPETHTKNKNHYPGIDLNLISSEESNIKRKIFRKPVFGVNGLKFNVNADKDPQTETQKVKLP